VTHITPELERRLAGAPDARHDVIILTDRPVDELLGLLPAGVAVRHVYRLRKGIAARASAKEIRSIDKVAGVTHVQPDETVSASS
jgi:hypothetical protein